MARYNEWGKRNIAINLVELDELHLSLIQYFLFPTGKKNRGLMKVICKQLDIEHRRMDVYARNLINVIFELNDDEDYQQYWSECQSIFKNREELSIPPKTFPEIVFPPVPYSIERIKKFIEINNEEIRKDLLQMLEMINLDPQIALSHLNYIRERYDYDRMKSEFTIPSEYIKEFLKYLISLDYDIDRLMNEHEIFFDDELKDIVANKIKMKIGGEQ